MDKYLSEEQLVKLLGVYNLPENFLPMSQDSYHEELIGNKIKNMKNPPELLASAINLAIVGYGNKRYGMFRRDNQIVNIQTVFKTYGILHQNDQGALLKEDDITPNRLCRFFRYHIRKYILDNNRASYLWRKYSDRDPRYLGVCFRGAEYLDDMTLEQADYLLNTVRTMDAKRGTSIVERIIRVFEAKEQVFTKV